MSNVINTKNHCCSSTANWRIICHAYCGSTLTACIGDLLPWFRKPSLQDMLKAYIIRSRVKTNTNMLIVQPYSPHLFRQGLLPGPGLLYDVLTGKVSTKEAIATWKKLEKERLDVCLHVGAFVGCSGCFRTSSISVIWLFFNAIRKQNMYFSLGR